MVEGTGIHEFPLSEYFAPTKKECSVPKFEVIKVQIDWQTKLLFGDCLSIDPASKMIKIAPNVFIKTTTTNQSNTWPGGHLNC